MTEKDTADAGRVAAARKETAASSPAHPRFAAFLSYSRSERKLCDQVHRGLEMLGRPFFRLRARRVFRDLQNLSAAGSLKAALAESIAGAGHFVLLASPSTAQSDWVEFEVNTWLSSHRGRARDLLILLCEGEVKWDPAANDFDWTRTTALPRALQGRFDEEPLYSDLREVIAESRPLKLSNPRFRDRLAEIAAPLDGRNKDEIVGRHLTVRRQIATALAIVTLFVSALGGWLFNRINEVNRQRAIDTARQRLARSADVLVAEGDPDHWSDALRAALGDAQSAVSELLARLPNLTQADETYIRAALSGLPGEIIRMPLKGVRGAIVSDDGRTVLADLEGEDLRPVWDVVAGREITRVPRTNVFSRSLRAYAWEDAGRGIVVDVAGVKWSLAGAAGKNAVPLAISGDGLNVAYVVRSSTGTDRLYLERRGGPNRPIPLCDVDTDSVARFSRDDGRIAAACRNSIQVWNAATGAVLAKLGRPQEHAVEVAFNEDGTRVALGTYRRVLLWAVDDPPRLLAEHQVVDGDEDEDLVSGIGLDPTGSRIAIKIEDQVIFCMDALSGGTIWPKLAAWQFGERGRYTPDFLSRTTAHREVGNREVVKGVALFDACSGTRLARVVLGSGLEAATFNDVRRQLAVANERNELFLVALRPASVYAEESLTGEVRVYRRALEAPVHAIVTDRRLRVWDIGHGTVLLESNGSFKDVKVSLSGDGETLAVLNGSSLSVWTCLRSRACGAGAPFVWPVRLSQTAGLMATSGYVLVNVPEAQLLLHLTGDELRQVRLPEQRRAVGLDSAAGGVSRLLLSDVEGARLWTAELKGEGVGPARQLAAGAAGDFPAGAAYQHLPGSEKVVVMGKKGTFIVDGTGGPPQRLGLRAREYSIEAFSEDGRYLAVAASPSNTIPEPVGPDNVEVVDLQAGRIVAKIEIPTHAAAMRFGHSGHLAIAANATTAGDAGFRVKIYQAPDWRVVTDAQVPGRPESVAFGPGDSVLAVGQRDGTTAVLNPAGVRVLNVPQRGRVVFCEFVGNGSGLATIGSSTDLTTLQVAPTSRKALAQQLLQVQAGCP